MGNFTYGFLSGYNGMGRYSKVTILLLALLGILSSFSYGQGCTPTGCTSAACTTTECPVQSSFGCAGTATRCINQTQAVTLPLCSIYNTVHNVIFLLGIVLIIL